MKYLPLIGIPLFFVFCTYCVLQYQYQAEVQSYEAAAEALEDGDGELMLEWRFGDRWRRDSADPDEYRTPFRERPKRLDGSRLRGMAQGILLLCAALFALLFTGLFIWNKITERFGINL